MISIFQNLFGKDKATELSAIVRQKDTLLVDVRSPQEFASGSVTGAVNIPLDQIPARIGQFKDKEHIVVFCRSGNRSAQAKSILERSGIRHVFNGGTWQNVNQIVNSKNN